MNSTLDSNRWRACCSPRRSSGAPLAAPAFAQTASGAPASSAAAATAAAAARRTPPRRRRCGRHAGDAAAAACVKGFRHAGGDAAFCYASDTVNSGDTAWMLTSSVLVLMMTIPGLALFYAGMVRKKNILATLAQSFGATCADHRAVDDHRLLDRLHRRRAHNACTAGSNTSCCRR